MIDSAIRFVIISGVVLFVVAMVFILVIAPMIYPVDKTLSESSFMERFDEKEKEVLDLIKDYKGKDDSGLTLVEVVAMSVLVAYPGEDILKNQSTDLGWSALPVTGNPDTDTSWDAEFYLETYRETTSFEWTVDMETKTIYAKNENGKDILDMLND